jgi:hypothetical protein
VVDWVVFFGGAAKHGGYCFKKLSLYYVLFFTFSVHTLDIFRFLLYGLIFIPKIYSTATTFYHLLYVFILTLTF